MANEDLRYVKGLKDLQEFLDDLPVKMERDIMRGGIRAGTKEIYTEALTSAPVLHGKLKEGIKMGTSVRGSIVRGYVRSTDFKTRWIEYGTAAHAITASPSKFLNFGGVFVKSVMHPGSHPHPFLRPALDNQATSAVIATGNYVKERLSSKLKYDTSAIFVGGDE